VSNLEMSIEVNVFVDNEFSEISQ